MRADGSGAVLRTTREDLGLSQRKLATIAELHPTHIFLLERERREPSLDTLVRIDRALGTMPGELVAEYVRRKP